MIGFHLHGNFALRTFLGESQLRLYGLDRCQFGFAAHRGHHFRGECFAFFIRRCGFGALVFFGARAEVEW